MTGALFCFFGDGLSACLPLARFFGAGSLEVLASRLRSRVLTGP
jgi:hypothetical protein